VNSMTRRRPKSSRPLSSESARAASRVSKKSTNLWLGRCADSLTSFKSPANNTGSSQLRCGKHKKPAWENEMACRSVGGGGAYRRRGRPGGGRQA
jgi:hypothetical protein